MSDDGRFALTMIAFVGSVFSPYYRFQRARGNGDPNNHCCLNLALYDLQSRKYRRWCMTERSQYSVGRSATDFVLGPSQVQWRNDSLQVEFDEWSLPFPQKVKGRFRLFPQGLSNRVWSLDHQGQHQWGPIATQARIEVELDSPSLRWSGHAYLDQNEGRLPVNDKACDFTEWDWSRALLPDGSTVVTYDVRNKVEAHNRLLGLRFSPDSSSVQEVELGPRQALKRTAWGLNREIRVPKVDHAGPNIGAPAIVTKTLEDTPFYSRNIVQAPYFGQSVQTMHETLQVGRLASIVTQGMLPFKMPRVR